MEDLIRDLEHLIAKSLANSAYLQPNHENLFVKPFSKLYYILNQYNNQHQIEALLDFSERMIREQEEYKRNIDTDYKKVLDTILKILRGEIDNIKIENTVDVQYKTIEEIIEEIRKYNH